ncbi:hypothetical protein B0H12DRAFT_1136937 [Mycena haematopus]|nr:hypothetical protein B0H12DRAFT_1136937 [Mycena haematopus]
MFLRVFFVLTLTHSGIPNRISCGSRLSEGDIPSFLGHLVLHSFFAASRLLSGTFLPREPKRRRNALSRLLGIKLFHTQMLRRKNDTVAPRSSWVRWIDALFFDSSLSSPPPPAYRPFFDHLRSLPEEKFVSLPPTHTSGPRPLAILQALRRPQLQYTPAGGRPTGSSHFPRQVFPSVYHRTDRNPSFSRRLRGTLPSHWLRSTASRLISRSWLGLVPGRKLKQKEMVLFKL